MPHIEDGAPRHHYPALDGEKIPARSNRQDWIVTWHPLGDVPDGRPHGAAGVCVTGENHIILVSNDQLVWDLPAGRPEAGESLEETLRREVHEEACATVLTARLLGFSRGECIDGWEKGLVLIRSFWRADVHLEPWEPQFEIEHRRILPATEASTRLATLDTGLARIAHRALLEAGVIESSNG